jgi:hypothetical protein
MKPDEVRAPWRGTFRKDVPKPLTRDLLVRILCWHIQEKAFGGHSSGILKLLASYAMVPATRAKAEPRRPCATWLG